MRLNLMKDMREGCGKNINLAHIAKVLVGVGCVPMQHQEYRLTGSIKMHVEQAGHGSIWVSLHCDVPEYADCGSVAFSIVEGSIYKA